MKKTLLAITVTVAGSAIATPFNGNDAQSNAMGNTGVASSEVQNAVNFNPALLADQYYGVGFGMTLPSIKVYIDDSNGLIDSATSFVDEGGTWDQFQTIDTDALQTAVNSISPTMTAIGTDIGNVGTAVDALEAATTEAQVNSAISQLNTASDSLTANSATLDTDVTTVNVQMRNLSNTTESAQDDLKGFSGKPLQLGLGIDILNAALPSETLGMAIGITTSTTIGASLKVAASDLQPVVDLSADLTGFSAEATNLTSAVNALAAANSDLTAYFESRPNPDTDPVGYNTWAAGLDAKQQAIVDAQTDVNLAQSNLSSYSGSNGTITNGELTLTTSDDPESEIEFVGANITEISLSAARRFVIAGEDIAFGITPKIQTINIFEKTISLENSEDEMSLMSSDPSGYFLNNTTSLLRANLDLGAAKSWDFHGKVRAGIALKDLIPWTLESKAGTELLIRPKLRVGAAHETKFTKLAIDLDITENQPLKYGVATRYLGIGGEVNAWGWAALRAGYRANLSVADSSVVSGGIGITPFGVGIEVSAWAKPSSFDDWAVLIQDMGAVVEVSMNF